MEENLQGLDKRKEGPIRVFQCANRRDAKCHRNIGRTELGGGGKCAQVNGANHGDLCK